MPASRSTRVFTAILRATEHRRRRRSVEQEAALIRRGALRPRRYSPPRLLDRRCRISVERVDGQVVYRLTPRHAPVQRRVIYLHGGGFVNEIYRVQWRLAGTLVRELSAEVIVPIYPLAPLATAERNYQRMVALYDRELRHGHAPALVGDSAGGGMVLALLLELVKAGLRLPEHAVLISPWLDLTVTDPRVRELARHDVLLSPEMLRAASALWAGHLPLDDPRVSPLLGDLAALRPTKFLLLSGTHDILNSDARTLRDRADQLGLDLTYLEEEDQPHVFVTFPTPEGRLGLTRIHDFLT